MPRHRHSRRGSPADGHRHGRCGSHFKLVRVSAISKGGMQSPAERSGTETGPCLPVTRDRVHRRPLDSDIRVRIRVAQCRYRGSQSGCPTWTRRCPSHGSRPDDSAAGPFRVTQGRARRRSRRPGLWGRRLGRAAEPPDQRSSPWATDQPHWHGHGRPDIEVSL